MKSRAFAAVDLGIAERRFTTRGGVMMPLRRKLLISMTIPALLLCTVGILGIFSLQQLKQAAGRILSHNYHTIQEARNMERILRSFESVQLGPPPETRFLYDLTAKFEHSLARCESNITEIGEEEILHKVRATWEDLKSRRLSGNSGTTLEEVRTLRSVNGDLCRDIDSVVALNEAAMFSFERETRHTAAMVFWVVTAALGLALLALITFSLVFARRISRPIVSVAQGLHRALNPVGLEKGATESSTDEIATLRQELDSLLERLTRYENEQRRRLSHMESRLAFVINEVLEGLVLIDSTQRILAVNRVARHILGVTGQEGKRLNELRPREDVLEMLRPVVEGTFQPEHDLGELKFVLNGAERVYRPRVLTISGSADAVEGYLLLFWDVTEQRRFEDSRRKFISMLSHQLKTPMTSLSMSVNLLREKLSHIDAAQSELLSIASEDCGALAGLISDLIEAAREPMADLSLRLRLVNLTRLLRAGLRPLIAQAEEKGIRLCLPKESGAVKAWVDPVKFPWVVTNIAGNSLRYTGKGGCIDISVSASAAGAVVAVSDTGVGIPQEDLAHVFEPYVSLDNEPEQGTHGLGLAIAREIVEAHKGTIAVESETGKGTTFHIAVPFDSREAV